MEKLDLKDEDLIQKRNSTRKRDSDRDIVINPILSIKADGADEN